MSATTDVRKHETRFDRAAWLIVGFLAVFTLVTLGTTLYVLTRPGDGWLILYSVPDPPPLGYFAGDWPTPLRAGDRVLTVEGEPIPIDSAVAPLEPPANWREGATVRYGVQRDGRTQDVAVTLHRLNIRGILRSLWHTASDLPLEWSWCLIAVVVFLLRPRERAAQLMLVAGISFTVVVKLGWAATMISRQFTPSPVFYGYQVAASFWGYLFFPSFIMLALIFPRRIWPLSRWPRGVPALLYGFQFVLTLAIFVIGDSNILTALLVLEAGLLVLACAAALLNARNLRNDPVARAQRMWFAFGLALSVAPNLILYLLTYGGIVAENGLTGLIDGLATIALPLCLGVAITRYHLFDIDLIINRTLVYVPLTAIVAGIFAAAIALSQKAFVALTGQESLASTILATIVVVAVFNPVKERVQKLVDNGFKELPSLNKQLISFENQLAERMSEVDVRPITRRFLEQATLAFDAESGAAYVDEQGTLKQIYAKGEWTGEERIGATVNCAGNRVARIALGSRRHGRTYSERDRKALEQAARAVGRAIEEDNHCPQAGELAFTQAGA